MDPKEELLDKIEELVGFVPPGARHLLKVLSHPDVIEDTKHYFNLMDVNSMCQKYAHPWSCAREAEALYENIKYGWLGAGSGVGYSEWWCANCRKKIIPEVVVPDHPDATLEEIMTAMTDLEETNKE